MSIGLQIFTHLGLDPAEAQKEDFGQSKRREFLVCKDGTGIGFKQKDPDFLSTANDAFARISAMCNYKINTKLTTENTETKHFIPTRRRKKSVSSLSNEDLAHILVQDDSQTEHRHHRRRHRHHSKEE